MSNSILSETTLQSKFDKLYLDSKNGLNFKSLMPIIMSEENILAAYKNIKGNKGSHTPGVDKRTIKDINRETTSNLLRMVRYKLNYYKPNRVKRVYISKPNGKKRPLGIPTIIDRLVQQCILQVLEPICEAKFYNGSYGFRPLRSANQAVADVYRKVQQQNLHYMVDVDIKGFFDNVDHNKLIKQMWHMGIRDEKLLMIIKQMLKAEIIDTDGTIIKPTKGTPQGGILSPLLSNIVLNELDWWIASQWEEMPTRHEYQGFMHKSGKRSKNPKFMALRKTKLKEVYIVRYADDFKLICRDYHTAKKAMFAVIDWLKTRLKLEVSPEKTKIINLRKGYSEFLGIQIKVKPKAGKYVVKSRIKPKSVVRIRDKLKCKLKDISTADTRGRAFEITLYNSMVLGIHNYYAMATDISLDMRTVGKSIKRVLKDRRPFNMELRKKGNKELAPEQYRDSKELRYLMGMPIYPISYIRTRPPMCSQNIEIYTQEGRAKVRMKETPPDVQWVMETYIPYRSPEYNANRVSRYKAQKGKCPITGELLNPLNMHCHHIIPRHLGGDDKYSNLVLVHKDAHLLIHATQAETIDKILKAYPNINIKKVNKFRQTAENAEIIR